MTEIVGTEKETWRSHLAMYGVLVVVPALFFLCFFSRFSGLRSGNGEYGTGVSYLAGQLPYRDYFTTAPPLNLMKSAMLLRLFGDALIVSRTAGVVERLLIASLLFHWLKQMFRPLPSLLASMVTIILSAGDRTDPLASYNHDAILWAMLSGFAASLLLSTERNRGWFISIAGASGAFAALSLMTKQTVGLGVLFTVLCVMAWLVYSLEGWGRSFLWCGAFAGGAALPLGGLVYYLNRLKVFPAFVQMLFVKGPAAKASHPIDFVYRHLTIGWDNIGWVVLGLFGLSLSWIAIRRATGPERLDPFQNPPMPRLAGILIAGGGVVLCAELLALTSLPVLHDFSKSSVYFVSIALTVLLGGFIPSGFLKGFSRYRALCILFCSVSWASAFMLSLSWPAFEAMLLPGLGFLLAALLSGIRRHFLPFAYAALALMVFMQVREKMDVPFGFDNQDDAPVRMATAHSTQPKLRGMSFSPETVRFLDDTVRLVQQHGTPTDTIFTYPEMGLLYSLTGKVPPTVASSHNIDVVNDAFAAEEADRLMRARPVVIVSYRLSEQQLRDAEILWRGGRSSGQRRLISAIESLVSGYELAGTYRLAPQDPEILVYVRR